MTAAYDFLVVDADTGELVGLALANPPSGASPLVREGFARRHAAALTGRCPCGGRTILPNRAERRAAARNRRAARARLEHEDGCPAIAPAVREWCP